ncbi:hypothetical protein C8046_02050 [Serinibacter arcticus]|uniref:DUF4261 domain-containing protein n=1 Tax=Serinibacter arcticus TaxID=1655435 RepID=A0A2U1ZRV5_9MICO|nr:hypothetical protein C8046_02050 [Serinibacter arcticus]
MPGPWADREEFVAAVSRDGWIVAGAVMLNIATRENHVVQLEGPEPRLVAAVAASAGALPDGPDLTAIAGHRSVAYLVDAGGSPERAAAAMAAGSALLRAGGLAVKVEVTGVSRTPAQWEALVADPSPLGVYRACVVTVRAPDEVYTCGMHSLGLPDVRVAATEADAGDLVDAFARYLLLEQPVVQAGETFALGAEEPGYRVDRDGSVDYDGDPLLTNPHGTWRLVALDG